MLGVGIDWAEEFHLVALGRPGEGVIDVARVEHDPRSLDALIARLVVLEPDPAEVRVVLETSYWDARGAVGGGRVHGGAGQPGSDRPSAWAGQEEGRCRAMRGSRVCWRWTASSGSGRWWPTATMAAELRAIARDDERAVRDERRLLNRLRADLIATFPAALTIAGDDMGAPTFLRLLERWPTANALAEASRDDLLALARAGHHGWPDRFADRVQTALRWRSSSWPGTGWCGPRPTPSVSPRSSFSPSARNAGSGRRRMGELLHRAHRGLVVTFAKDNERGPAVPGGEIYLSFPGPR